MPVRRFCKVWTEVDYPFFPVYSFYLMLVIHSFLVFSRAIEKRCQSYLSIQGTDSSCYTQTLLELWKSACFFHKDFQIWWWNMRYETKCANPAKKTCCFVHFCLSSPAPKIQWQQWKVIVYFSVIFSKIVDIKIIADSSISTHDTRTHIH